MDKDRIKGKMDEVVGRAKRQVGEWTGDTKTQGEGAAEEVKGKVQNAWGNVKDTARDAKHDLERDVDKENRDIEEDRERDIA
jgi:uncharacterized protein YjbJ (UPF0337 family)